MIAEISTTLDCTAQRAWAEVKKTKLLLHVTSPLLTFELLEPPELPQTFGDEPLHFKLKLLGLLPIGRQWVVPIIVTDNSTSGAQEYKIRDNGSGSMAKVWDHLITISESADGRTNYSDRVEIQAGVLTPFVWLFANIFYRHRQRRWRRLAASGFDYQD